MSRLAINKVGIAASLLTAAMVTLGASSPSHAALITYTFSPGSSFTVGPDTEAVSGSFTVDTANTTLTGSVTLTGDSPLAGIYSSVHTFGNNEADFNKPNIDLKFHFNDDFGASSYSLVSVEVEDGIDGF